MSLRIFHIIFVIVCVGLSVCVGVWGIRDWMLERSAGALALGIIFLISGLVSRHAQSQQCLVTQVGIEVDTILYEQFLRLYGPTLAASM